MALVTCRGMSRSFGRGERAVVAVHAATCSVGTTSRVAVTGPSGSGKSTLLHLLAGLDTPTSGEVSWPELGSDPTRRRGAVGVVFQGASLIPPLTVLENVAFPLLLQGSIQFEAEDRGRGALAGLGLEALADKLPEELSGGQAQRVCVARVLATRPRLIVADEPTGQLDSHAGHHVLDVLVAAAHALGAGLLVSTHDPEMAAHLDERWQMLDGRLQLTPNPVPRGGDR
jgi:putative ABC transport system ATP-binding protein